LVFKAQANKTTADGNTGESDERFYNLIINPEKLIILNE
jgi:hypothetical protein